MNILKNKIDSKNKRKNCFILHVKCASCKCKFFIKKNDIKLENS